ncbi:nucleotidyl transferase AbiEii/AbiGii toxin family protein [Duganella violaceipulchra]|uniref:Nucleotidyl transferase AbiEii/AbiGii toxin family protein n=1 Tax=Duganella violaceipulchra TaxID=2849652 RepID=A0AA41HD06_9BURK|nr:nucleotidyl transferase AbiEii/AbiGii toxin family protein [Duganella violaceicalia]MBV6325140.1 nucleotidyl transferase AbiEii/AbiGii toxin family protein [Duganella violaceicalia]MCP2011566.1 hypothetical protein [Duganella violaceicalia]
MNDFELWISSAKTLSEKNFRSVVHIILNAISSQHELQTEMVMKGGILMAIAYHTGRYTRDIDFSTSRHYSEFQDGQANFIENIGNAIKLSSAQLPYDFSCAIQSSEVRPGILGNFQTLHLTVGYAPKNNAKAMKRLNDGQASQVVKIDYSFNELVGDLGLIDVGGEEHLQTYGLLTLIAEKYRALIQQGSGTGKRVRGSSRGQDIFDLHSLLAQSPPSKNAQEHLVQLLIEKAHSREVTASRSSMADPAVFDKSKDRYEALKHEIDGELPDFDEAFSFVQSFYELMPWPQAQTTT